MQTHMLLPTLTGNSVRKSVIRRAFIVSAVVGTLLTTVNHQQEIIQGHVDWFWLINYAIPFTVSFYVGWRSSRVQVLHHHKLALELKKANFDIVALNQQLEVQTKELATFKDEKSKQDWVSSTLGHFLKLARSRQQDENFYDQIISFVCRSLEANQGALYIVENEGISTTIRQQTTFAYGRKKFLKKQFLPGEGLIGQCFYEKNRIFIKKVPPDYINITSGLGAAPPSVVLVEPLIIRNEIVGLIELAWFKEPLPHFLDALREIGLEIGNLLLLEKDQTLTQNLLQQSEEKSKTLQAKENELRQSLVEMQEIQEKMKSREDELSRALTLNRKQSLQHEMMEIKQLIEHIVADCKMEMRFLSQLQPIKGMARAIQHNDFDIVGNSSYVQWKDRFVGNVTSLMESKKVYRAIELSFVERGMVAGLMLSGEKVSFYQDAMFSRIENQLSASHEASVRICREQGRFYFDFSLCLQSDTGQALGSLHLQLFADAVVNRIQSASKEPGWFELHDNQKNILVSSRGLKQSDAELLFTLSHECQLIVKHIPE